MIGNKPKIRKLDIYDRRVEDMDGYLYGEHRDEDLNSKSWEELEDIWNDELGYDENDEGVIEKIF